VAAGGTRLAGTHDVGRESFVDTAGIAAARNHEQRAKSARTHVSPPAKLSSADLSTSLRAGTPVWHSHCNSPPVPARTPQATPNSFHGIARNFRPPPCLPHFSLHRDP